jgi:Rod binding domain-containing protein
MDSTKLILTEAVSPPAPLGQLSETPFYEKTAKLESSKIQGGSEEAGEQAAKAFESVLIGKLLDVMNNTIGEWGFERDGISKQIKGMFSMYMAQHIADNGGFGLWRDIHQYLTDSGGAKTTAETKCLGKDV